MRQTSHPRCICTAKRRETRATKLSAHQKSETEDTRFELTPRRVCTYPRPVVVYSSCLLSTVSPSIVRHGGFAYWSMAHAWKACWCNSLTSSNLVSSARIGTPETVENIRFPGFCFGSFRLSVPSRFPPFRHLWPRPAARVTYRNRRFRKRLQAFACRAFVIEVRLRPMCPVSGPIRIPSCFPRSFFRFGSQQSQPPYRKRIVANTGRPSAKVPPDPLR